MVASLSQGLGAVECRTAHLIQGGDRVIQRRLALATRANLPPYSHCLRPVLSPQPQQSGGSDDASQGSSRRRRQLAPRLCSPNVLSLIGASDPLPKVLAAVPLAYFVSPIQLIPSFIRC